jgi:hypothetical protein
MSDLLVGMFPGIDTQQGNVLTNDRVLILEIKAKTWNLATGSLLSEGGKRANEIDEKKQRRVEITFQRIALGLDKSHEEQ